MVEQEITWLGLKVGDFEIDETLGEGAFSAVYRGVRSDGVEAAFKVAKPRDLIAMEPVVKKAPSQAICFYSGGVQGVHPDAVDLLQSQAGKIISASDPSLPRIDKVVAEEGFAYYQMELLDGQTLRAEIADGPIMLSVLAEAARVLDQLTANKEFQFHGDLKPENIMVTSSGVRVLDPGHFDRLQCQEELFERAVVTTPAYYPLLEPHDLFAFGLMLWEIGAGYHPLMVERDDDSVDIDRISAPLFDWIRSQEQVGLYFLRPLLQLTLPCDARPELSESCQDFLMKALGLRLVGDLIDRGPSFASFAEIADELDRLQSSGQTTW